MIEIEGETAEERQDRYRNIPLADLEHILREFMVTRRPGEVPDRLDALTIYTLRAAK